MAQVFRVDDEKIKRLKEILSVAFFEVGWLTTVFMPKADQANSSCELFVMIFPQNTYFARRK